MFGRELKRADEIWLESIERSHGSALRRFLRGLAQQDADVEDLAQETLLRAWRTVKNDPAKQSLELPQGRMWLFAIARNVTIDRWRAGERRPHDLIAPMAIEEIGGAADPTDAALDGLVMREALARLSGDHRAVLECMHRYGYTVAQTADVLGVAPGTVKSRSYYALRALRTICDELGVTR